MSHKEELQIMASRGVNIGGQSAQKMALGIGLCSQNKKGSKDCMAGPQSKVNVEKQLTNPTPNLGKTSQLG